MNLITCGFEISFACGFHSGESSMTHKTNISNNMKEYEIPVIVKYALDNLELTYGNFPLQINS